MQYNMISMCIFIGCWLWPIKGHTQMTSNSRQQTCFSFFMPPNSFNKQFEFLLYKTNRLYFFRVCVYCKIDHRRHLQHVNNSHATQLRLMSYFLFLTRWRHLWSVTAQKNGNLHYSRGTRTELCDEFAMNGLLEWNPYKCSHFDFLLTSKRHTLV